LDRENAYFICSWRTHPMNTQQLPSFQDKKYKFLQYIKKIYEVQTNLFVQIVQTSIWTTESTFKGVSRGSVRGDLQKRD